MKTLNDYFSNEAFDSHNVNGIKLTGAPNKIVFACDYNPKTDTKAIDSLKEFVRPFRSKIYVLNITSLIF